MDGHDANVATEGPWEDRCPLLVILNLFDALEKTYTLDDFKGCMSRCYVCGIFKMLNQEVKP